MAASSSSSASPCYEPLSSSSVPKHDIFLSHSGAQKPFVAALYQQLQTRYSTFFDITHHSLPLGEDFPSHIFHAARTCRLAVVVVSQEYLRSKWPMLELCAFVEAKPPPKIVPLFFKLAPYDLKQKENKEVWRTAWAKFAKEDSRIKVSEWESALKELAKRNGIPLNLSDGESACIDKVFSSLCENLPPSMRHDFSGVPGIHRMSQVVLAKFEKLDIDQSKVCVLGMYGLPGSGKSTLCRYLCDYLFPHFSGKALYLELPTGADDEQLLVKSKELFKQLTSFNNKMDLSNALHLRQVYYLLRGTDFSNSRVFLVVDNISSEKSRNFVKALLRLGLAEGSKVLLVARSIFVLLPLLQDDRSHLSSHYVYGNMNVPSLNKEEALRVLLQYGDGVGFVDAYAPEATLTPRHRQVMEEVVNMSSFGENYLPLVLKIMGEQLRQHELDVENWNMMMTSFWTGVGMYKEEALKQLVLQSFKALPGKLQTLFLDTALFIIPLSRLDGESAMVGEAFLHLSLIQGCKQEEIECEMRELQKHGFLTVWEGKHMTPTISVHDVYLEFAASIEEASQYYWSSGLKWSKVQRNQAIEVARNTELGVRTVVLELEEGREEFQFSPRFSRVKAMVLRSCKSVKILWGFANLTSLATLDICNCPSLKWVEPPAIGCEQPYLQRVRWSNQGHDVNRVQQQHRWDALSMSMKLLWKAFQEFVLRMGMTGRSVMEVARLLLQMRGLEVLRLENAGLRQQVDLSGCLPQLRVLELTSEHHMMQFRVCNLPNLERFVYCGDAVFYVPQPEWTSSFCAVQRKGVMIGTEFLAGCPKLQGVHVLCTSMEDELQGITIASPHLKDLWVNSVWNLSRLPALTAVPESLEQLTLWDCPKLLSVNFGCTYRNLRTFYLGHCPNVTEVTGLDGLPNLHTLWIKSCTSLKKVSGLGGLVSLRKFQVGGCPNLLCCLLHDLESLTEVRHIEYHGPGLMDVRGFMNLATLRLVNITAGTMVGVESLNHLRVLYLEETGGQTRAAGSTRLVDLATLLGVAVPSHLSFLSSLSKVRLVGLRTLTSLKGIGFLRSLHYLYLEGLPNLTCLQGIQSLGGLAVLLLRRCASLEELPSLSALVNLTSISCRDCIKLSSVKGCGGLACLGRAYFTGCQSLACFPLWGRKDWNGIVELEIEGSKFASVEAAMAWVEDREVPQPLRMASMAALHWELSKSSTDKNQQNACEMLLDRVLLKMDYRCYNDDDYSKEVFTTQLSLLAKNYRNFERTESCHGFYYKNLYFTSDSKTAKRYHEARPRMLEEALQCFAKLPKQCLIDQCHCDPHFPLFVLHLFNCACTSSSFP